jgi:hypothetical protein
VRQVAFGLLILASTILVVAVIVEPNSWKQHVFIWFPMLPGFISYVIYWLARKNYLKNYFAHMAINDQKFVKTSGGIFSRQTEVDWNDVREMTIKLFEVNCLMNDGSLIKIDLNGLTDDNLKRVKEVLHQIKEQRKL